MHTLCWILLAMIATAPPAAEDANAAALGLRVEPAARRVTLPARVCLREGALEFLLCRRGTKEHESILHTDTAGVSLHAALLALDLLPGLPAEWTPAGEPLPPRGGHVRVELHWRDEQGGEHCATATDWIAPAADGAAAPPVEWVFVGSAVLPGGTYLADAEGGIISVANFASAVLDVPIVSSDRNELLAFAARSEAIPPVGTAVEVIIAPAAGAESAPHARATVDLDRFGQAWADGETRDGEQLAAWAARLLAGHARARVELRVAGEALVWDVELAARALRTGGVRDIVELRLPPEAPPLPRTEEQARHGLAMWRDRLAHPQEYVHNPAGRAEALLERIDRRATELEVLRRLWLQYADDLRRALNRRAETHPAEDQP